MVASQLMASAGSAGAPPGTETSLLGDTRQFVTFSVHNETFAVPLAEVQEIIRMPEVVQVPLSPPSLEGLANLRGALLPVSSLRRVFRIEDAPHDDATRVVVINQGEPIGFVVDRMSIVVNAEAGQIETAQGIQSTVNTELLSGMIKHSSGMIMILDPARLIEIEYQGMARRNRAGRALHGSGAASGEDGRTAEAADEIQLVSFVVAGQEYALPIEQVQEIVQVPDQISHLPKAESHVVGVITLRNRLLPLVSLRRMFGLPDRALDEHNRIVVIALAQDSEHERGASVGVVMDTVKEVLRVSRSLVDPVPALLTQGCNAGELQSICRLQEGRRLVTILSAEKMFHNGKLRAAIEAHRETIGDAEMYHTDHRHAQGAADEEEQFVIFRLADEDFGVPIDSVQEIVRVPDELTHLPKTPKFIEGVVNLRGSVLPVVDQRRRFGLPAIERNDRQRIVVFTINGLRTGFIVDSVLEVLKIAKSVIEPAPDISAEQARLITRVANIEKHKRMILLLDVVQLLDVREMGALSTVHS